MDFFKAFHTICENMNQILLIMSRTWIEPLAEVVVRVADIFTKLTADTPHELNQQVFGEHSSSSQASNCQAETTRTAAARETVCCAAPAVRPMEL